MHDGQVAACLSRGTTVHLGVCTLHAVLCLRGQLPHSPVGQAARHPTSLFIHIRFPLALSLSLYAHKYMYIYVYIYRDIELLGGRDGGRGIQPMDARWLEGGRMCEARDDPARESEREKESKKERERARKRERDNDEKDDPVRGREK